MLLHSGKLVFADFGVVGSHGNAEWRVCDRAVCRFHLAARVSVPCEQCIPLPFQVHGVHTCIPWQCHSIHPTYAVATKKL